MQDLTRWRGGAAPIGYDSAAAFNRAFEPESGVPPRLGGARRGCSRGQRGLRGGEFSAIGVEEGEEVRRRDVYRMASPKRTAACASSIVGLNGSRGRRCGPSALPDAPGRRGRLANHAERDDLGPEVRLRRHSRPPRPAGSAGPGPLTGRAIGLSAGLDHDVDGVVPTRLAALRRRPLGCLPLTLPHRERLHPPKWIW